MRLKPTSVGCDGLRSETMATITNPLADKPRAGIAAETSLLPILGALAAGLFLLYFAGFAQASVLHDAAHDTRHSIAFPCH